MNAIIYCDGELVVLSNYRELVGELVVGFAMVVEYAKYNCVIFVLSEAF
jgi:hypothetical protein